MTNLPNIWHDFDRPFASSLGAWRPLLRQLDDVMNEMVSGTQMFDEKRVFVPSVDVEDTDDHLIMRFDMPGLEKENIDIEVQGRQLMISGERKQEHENGEARSRLHERRYGKFQRVFALPDDIKTDEIEAQYHNGVLTVAVPKSAESKRQKIKIGESRNGFLSKFLGQGSKKETIDIKSTDQTQSANAH